MITFTSRTVNEQELIRKTYEFEVEAVRTDSCAPNPWYAQVLDLEDGDAVWEAILEAVEMAEVNGLI